MTTPEEPESAESDGLPQPDEAGWAAPTPPPAPSTAPPPPPSTAPPSDAWGASTPSAAWGASTPSAGWAAPAGVVAGAPRQSVNGMAVASLVLGLCCWCFFVPGILAVIFGYRGLGQIAMSEGREKGRGMAIAGIVLGWISIAALAGLAIAWLGYGLSNL